MADEKSHRQIHPAPGLIVKIRIEMHTAGHQPFLILKHLGTEKPSGFFGQFTLAFHSLDRQMIISPSSALYHHISP
jgi:hypothetical protein